MVAFCIRLADSIRSALGREVLMGGGTLTSAIAVARYLIHLACNEDEPECLSPMRLQKLLYYVQGWSLVHRNQPMFTEKIEAWAHGPVVPEVFHAFKQHGRSAIPDTEGDPAALTDEESAFVRSVWNTYKPYSAISLSDMTHSEPPWLDARGTLPREAACSREVTRKALKDFFGSQIRDEAHDGKQGRKAKRTAGR